MALRFSSVVQGNYCFANANFLNAVYRGRTNIYLASAPRKFSAQFQECCSAKLPICGGPCVQAEQLRKRADQQSDGEHHEERDDVLRVVYRKCEARRHEEKVESGDAEERGKNRLSRAEKR